MPFLIFFIFETKKKKTKKTKNKISFTQLIYSFLLFSSFQSWNQAAIAIWRSSCFPPATTWAASPSTMPLHTAPMGWLFAYVVPRQISPTHANTMRSKPASILPTWCGPVTSIGISATSFVYLKTCPHTPASWASTPILLIPLARKSISACPRTCRSWHGLKILAPGRGRSAELNSI